jgi:hypothetical protein
MGRFLNRAYWEAIGMKVNPERANAIKTLEFLAVRAPSIPFIPSTQLMREMNMDARAGRSMGASRSWLDYGAMINGLPLIGRLIVLEDDQEESGAWAPWQPNMAELVQRAAAHLWTERDLFSIKLTIEASRYDSHTKQWQVLEPLSVPLLQWFLGQK